MNRTLEQDKEDLECAGIPSFYKPQTDKNMEQMEGRLETSFGTFLFHRNRRYWTVKCHVPLSIAEKIFSHPEGKRSVRADGHCLALSPLEFVKYFNKEGKELVLKSELESLNESIKKSIIESNRYEFVDNVKSEGEPFIDNYHIDSQAGLLLFVQMVKNI